MRYDCGTTLRRQIRKVDPGPGAHCMSMAPACIETAHCAMTDRALLPSARVRDSLRAGLPDPCLELRRSVIIQPYSTNLNFTAIGECFTVLWRKFPMAYLKRAPHRSLRPAANLNALLFLSLELREIPTDSLTRSNRLSWARCSAIRPTSARAMVKRLCPSIGARFVSLGLLGRLNQEASAAFFRPQGKDDDE